MTDLNLMEVIKDSTKIGINYHIYKTGVIPNQISISKFDKPKWKKFRTYVEESFPWNPNNKLEFQYYIPEGSNYSIYVLHLNCGITLFKNSLQNAIALIFNSDCDQEKLSILKEKFINLKEREYSNRIGILQSDLRNLFVDFCKYKLYENDLIEHMGDEINRFRQNLIENFTSDNGRGLYILHGKTGTGKTSFIKSVLSQVDKKALYISPAFTEELTSPRLISLLIDYPDSILVIEDAESVIMERKADNSSAVSNLLNLTDGFLSDFLNLKIICTFNTDLSNIDTALLRDGRLKGVHKFEKLNPELATKVASVLGENLNPEKPLTLAEICNSTNLGKTYNFKKIGFIN